LLRFGPNTLTFTPTEPGTYRYACAMGMYHGVIQVIPPPRPHDGRTQAAG
jgi:plastocyanin domain-containing protein